MVRVVKLGIKRPVTHDLLPDPEPREVKYTLLSVDDHLMEPKHTFEGRLPAKLQDRAVRILTAKSGLNDEQARVQLDKSGGSVAVALRDLEAAKRGS